MRNPVYMGFDNGSINSENWSEMKNFIDLYGPRSVLEIGCGYSTMLFSKELERVLCLEADLKWANTARGVLNDEVVTILNYDYPNFPELHGKKYDFAFVDGPVKTSNGREDAMRFASLHADRIFIHDCSRDSESEAMDRVFVNDEWKTVRFRAGLCIVAKYGEDEEFNGWLKEYHGNLKW